MGIKEVQKEILADARKEAQKIIAAAEKERDEILSATADELKQEKDSAAKSLKQELATLAIRDEASSKLAAKKVLFAKKKELIDTAFQEALQKVASAPAAQKKAQLEKLLKRAGKETTVAHIHCNASDKRLIKSKAKVVEDNALIGGVIVENKDQTIRIDYSYNTLFDTLREQLLGEVALKLFGKNV